MKTSENTTFEQLSSMSCDQLVKCYELLPEDLQCRLAELIFDEWDCFPEDCKYFFCDQMEVFKIHYPENSRITLKEIIEEWT